ncbi:MAG: DUF6034 family protein [Wujia sp.]
MRKKFYVFATVCTLGLALSACGKKEVKYQPDSPATMGDAQEEEGGNKLESGLAKSLGVEETLIENITTDDGESIKIYGDVLVPDTNELSVYHAKKKSFDDMEVRKDIVEKISDDGKIYSANEEDLPTYILSKRANQTRQSLSYWEEEIQNATDDSIKEDYQKYYQDEKEVLDRYEQLIASAGDEFVETTYDAWKAVENKKDDETINYLECQVIIMRDGKPWYLMVDSYSGMTMSAVDYKDYFPDKAEEYESIEGSFYKEGNGKVVDDALQSAYVDPAIEFIRELNIGEFRSQGRVYIPSFYGTKEENGKYDSKNIGDVGAYLVSFVRDLDGVGIDAGKYWSMCTYENVEESYSYYPVEKYLPEEILICVGENGQILGMNMAGIIETPQVQTQGVELLQFDQIKEIILNQLQSNPPVNGNGWSSSDDESIKYDIQRAYSDLKLEYFRMPDENNEEEFVIVPVWCLQGDMSDSYSSINLIINAMDGSVIDPGEVLFRMEKWEQNETGYGIG